MAYSMPECQVVASRTRTPRGASGPGAAVGSRGDSGEVRSEADAEDAARRIGWRHTTERTLTGDNT